MKGMKACELCAGAARMYCESDEASLCFDCDAKVHGANFLVARHSRVLLCRNCQDPTPWKAAGAKLIQAVSVCDRCVEGRSKKVDDDEAESRERDQQSFSSSSRLSYLPSPVRTTAIDETVSDSFRPLKTRKKLDLICSNSHKLLVDFI
ncbi:uncharacterized protein A4U43_C03F8890 [Asparagus officinalis]|uniref:B box-type domain-containing protein n=1 Tax=Asparagus officinalis TaxID=4686 RepID=A0A5P1FB86_ASPOF|nr:uncharacterized protein A4U43_C03F8890 [Asparagus officinalis]